MHGDAVPERGVHTPGVRPSTPASVRVVVTSLVALFATSSARAQLDCPSPGFGPLEVTPADGAPLVSRDAFVLVRYSDGYFAEDGEVPVETIFLETDLGVDVPGEVQRVGDAQLFFVPDAPLAPSTNYFGIATGPDGDFEFGFRTGTTFDEAAPQIVEGNDDRSFEVRTGRIEPSCEAPDGGIRVGLSVTRASDDGPAGSVEYHLYLTRAPELTAPRLVARARNFTSAETMTLAFVLPNTESGTSVCVSLVVTDGVGHDTRWDEPVCFDPTDESTFLGLCTQSVAPPARGVVPSALVGFVVCLALLVRRGGRVGPTNRRLTRSLRT